MQAALPQALTAALEALLHGVGRKDLAAAAEKLSAGYRTGQTSAALVTAADAIAYAVARSPATYAACAAVFMRLSEAVPGFAPATVLDVGAGTGAASWAADAAWPGVRVTMLDRNPALRALARRLADAGLAGAEILSGDLAAEKPRADLVVASYVLAELAQDKAADAACDLWPSANIALALVEPGTPAGFARIRLARAALIAAGAHVAAPCTHDAPCPMSADDWCHFSQRLPRARDHMLLKGATVPFEDERYAYVVVTREKPKRSTARILAPPLEAKPGLTFKLCDETGLGARFVPARDRNETRRMRRKDWGDLF
ncbi:MAG TPA: small ribosomal subunit Rsm22 family protein [Rhizomicrobium sp.]